MIRANTIVVPSRELVRDTRKALTTGQKHIPEIYHEIIKKHNFLYLGLIPNHPGMGIFVSTQTHRTFVFGYMDQFDEIEFTEEATVS